MGSDVLVPSFVTDHADYFYLCVIGRRCRVRTAVQSALQDAVSRVLTPKKSTDVLREVRFRRNIWHFRRVFFFTWRLDRNNKSGIRRELSMSRCRPGDVVFATVAMLAYCAFLRRCCLQYVATLEFVIVTLCVSVQ